jgi:hypothetical protein
MRYIKENCIPHAERLLQSDPRYTTVSLSINIATSYGKGRYVSMSFLSPLDISSPGIYLGHLLYSQINPIIAKCRLHQVHQKADLKVQNAAIWIVSPAMPLEMVPFS